MHFLYRRLIKLYISNAPNLVPISYYVHLEWLEINERAIFMALYEWLRWIGVIVCHVY